jgi:tRNA dimethylallyltransferase
MRYFGYGVRQDMLRTVVCIMGPTASGKTDLACALYNKISSRLISVDSAMVYRGMNIGSAKPDTKLLQQYPHALIDIYEPCEIFSAGDFVEKVTREIDETLAAGKLPILVGGSMMYFRRLQFGVAELPAADAKFRAKLAAQFAQCGWDKAHAELQQVDPVAAKKIHPNDTQRIVRALEVYHLAGKPISTLQQETTAVANYNFLNIALLPTDRAWLHQRIAKRIDLMLEQGLIVEVTKLMADPRNHANLPAMKSVGYAEIWQYCNGELDLLTAREKAIVASRRLAKHQLTWLRSWENLHVFAAEDDNLVAVIDLINSSIA